MLYTYQYEELKEDFMCDSKQGANASDIITFQGP